MIYNVYMEVDRRNTAGLKAPEDISQISEMNGFKRFDIPKNYSGSNWWYSRLWLTKTTASIIVRMARTLQPGDLMVIQNNIYGVRPLAKAIPLIRKAKGCQFVILIHDLESLRKGIKGVIENNEKRNDFADRDFLDAFDWIISHNSKMTEYLTEIQGIKPKKIINLEIFDYLTDIHREQKPKGEIPSIAIAGNLAKEKCGYIYDIPCDPDTLIINLYGNRFEENQKREGMVYHGSFKPEELPMHLLGDFGLVWDGDSAETCSGNTGNYLKYNNPHKTSLYLASNMPVIVWNEAAIADFVLGNGVGIAVESLKDIGNKIREISDEEYSAMCKNVEEVSKKLRNGYFYSRAIEKCHFTE